MPFLLALLSFYAAPGVFSPGRRAVRAGAETQKLHVYTGKRTAGRSCTISEILFRKAGQPATDGI